MLVKHVTSLDDLSPYRTRWDELADDCVFRSWAWQTTWWKHYGEGRQLFVLLAFADDNEGSACTENVTCADEPVEPSKLLAILPCYIETSLTRGRVLRLLGDGEVCTDHIDVLVDPTDVEHAANALATHLVMKSEQWDTTEFTAIGSDCVGLTQLAEALEARDCHVTHTPNENRWSVPLPDNWEAFLALQSKSHRKQLRRLERRVLDSQQAVWHLVTTPSEFEVAWSILIDLHQRRRISLGEPGCFASDRWANFHRDIARQLLDLGQLRLSWLEVSGQPAAAEYHLASSRATWAYQGGVDPDRIDEEPGRLSMIRTLQHAIAEGHQEFDFLRGDEPYKAHWRAQPRPTFDIRIVPARGSAIWRNQACNYLQRAARVARQLTNMLS